MPSPQVNNMTSLLWLAPWEGAHYIMQYDLY